MPLALAALTVCAAPAGAQIVPDQGLRDGGGLFDRDRERDQQTLPNGLRGEFDPNADADNDTDRQEQGRRRSDDLSGRRGRRDQTLRDDGDGDRERDPEREARRVPVRPGEEDQTARRVNERDNGEERDRDDPLVPQPEPPDDAERREETTDPDARRPEQPGPYDPLGVRVGSFLVFPEMLLETVFSDNALQSPNDARRDNARAITSSLRFRSNWSRHLLEGGAHSLFSYYSEFDQQNDKDYGANLRGRLDVSRKTRIESAASYERTLEELSDTDSPAGAAERTPIKTSQASLQLSRQFNRLTALVRGVVTKNDYDDVPLINGGVANNDDRDYTEQQIVSRLSYGFRPGVAAFVEGSRNRRDYDSPVDDDGIRRDSTGYTILSGLTLDLGSKLTGEFSGGFARQTPKDSALEDVEGPIVNAALVWRATPLTTLRFNATSEIRETTSVDSAGSLVHTARLALEHAFRRNLIAGVSIGYEFEDFAQSHQEDRDYLAGLTAEYRLSRSLALVGRYDFTKSTSSVPDSDYIENKVRLGLRLRR